MKLLSMQQAKPRSITPIIPKRSSLLQRKCACGGTPGPTGECAACRRKRMLTQSAFHQRESLTDEKKPNRKSELMQHAERDVPPTSFREDIHSFAQLSVFPTVTHEQAMAEAEREELINGIVSTAALPCYSNGALSACNPSTGNYDITANNNTCCTRSCSQEHEEQHVADLEDCCQGLAARIAAGGNRATLIGQYNTWMRSGAKDWSECNAYSVSLRCAQELQADNACDISSSQCCTEIDDYVTLANAQWNNYCTRAPASRPACPF